MHDTLVSSPPRVSIGMPVFNGEAHLNEAIHSVMQQTFEDFELIVADNASTDTTPEICRTWCARDERIRYLRNDRNLGAAPNYNLTFARSRGEYFKWLPHDDLISPTFLERCVSELDAAPADVCLCCTRRRIMLECGRILRTGSEPNSRRRSYDDISFLRLMLADPNDAPIVITSLIRRDVLQRTGLIGSFPSADLLLIAELRMLGRFVQLDEPLFTSRLHRLTPAFQQSRCTRDGLAAWFDSRNANDDTHQPLDLKTSMRALASRHATGWFTRLYYHVGISAMLLMRRCIPLKRRVYRLWEDRTLAWLVRDGRLQLGLRSWALLSGIHHRDWRLALRSVGFPGQRQRLTLLEFASERVALRQNKWGPDERAERIISARLADADPLRYTAALCAMLRHSQRFSRQLHEHLASSDAREMAHDCLNRFDLHADRRALQRIISNLPQDAPETLYSTSSVSCHG